MTQRVSIEVAVKVNAFIMHLSSGVKPGLSIWLMGVQGEESHKSNGRLGHGKTGPAARVNISHLSRSGYRN